MTYEEAKSIIENRHCKNNEHCLDECMYGKGKCEYDMALSALEKQIPKKPIRANRAIEIDGQFVMIDENEYWKCPICTHYDVPLRENQKYCHYCGQVLDWSDTE